MIEIRAPDNSKRMNNAYLAAKGSGFLNLSNFHFNEWPREITDFNDTTFEGGRHWEEFDLVKIDLSHNNITFIDPNISNLRGLTVFKMIHNKVDEIPDEFFLLEAMKILDFSFNIITKIPERMCSCINLTEINFSGNKIKKLPINLSSLRNLELLIISENCLEILPSDVGGLYKLQKLDVSGNQIRTLPFQFENLKLNFINLAKNNIKEIVPDCFFNQPELSYLDLRQNALEEFFEFPKSAKLETMNLSNNRIRQIGNLTNSRAVVNLDLKNNKLEVQNDEIFLLQNLKLLDISNNDLQNLPPELGLMKGLVKVLIEGNPMKSIRMGIRQQGTEALKKYLASRINFDELQKKQEGLEKMANLESQSSQRRLNNSNVQNSANDAEIIKKNMVIEEFLGQKKDDPWKTLIREFITSEGFLRIIKKSINTISPLLLDVGNLKGLDLGGNNLAQLPDFISKLTNLTFLRLADNQLREFETKHIVTMPYLAELNLSGNKLTHIFMKVGPSHQDLIKNNMLMQREINLSKNAITDVPTGLVLFENVTNINLAYNRLTSIDNLFINGCLERLDTLDLSNNKIVFVPENIWRWVMMTNLNMENNEIRNFPPEIGFLNLNGFQIQGNPTMLVKNAVTRKGIPAVLAYLKEKHQNSYELDEEISRIREQICGKPVKKYQEVEKEWEFDDPFKRKADGSKSKPKQDDYSNSFSANNYNDNSYGTNNKRDSNYGNYEDSYKAANYNRNNQNQSIMDNKSYDQFENYNKPKNQHGNEHNNNYKKSDGYNNYNDPYSQNNTNFKETPKPSQQFNDNYNQQFNDNSTQSRSYQNINQPRNNDNYNQSRNNDSYNQPRNNDNYSQARNNDSYNQPRNNDNYNQSRNNDSYNQSRNNDNYNQPRNNDNYNQPRNNDSYNQSRNNDNYNQPRNNDNSYGGSNSNTNSQPHQAQPPQQNTNQFQHEIDYSKKRISEIENEMNNNFSINRLQKMALTKELNQLRTRYNSMIR